MHRNSIIMIKKTVFVSNHHLVSRSSLGFGWTHGFMSRSQTSMGEWIHADSTLTRNMRGMQKRALLPAVNSSSALFELKAPCGGDGLVTPAPTQLPFDGVRLAGNAGALSHGLRSGGV